MTTEDTTQVAPVETQTAPVEVAPVVAEPSLEDVYKEAGVVEAKPQPEQAYVPPAAKKIDIPDPYDDGHKDYLAAQQERLNAIEAHQQMQLHAQAKAEQAAANAKLVEDIKVASSYILDNSGMKDLPYSDEVKASFANMELESKAKSDPKFQALWHNRDKNPEAWGKALAIVTKEIGKKYDAQVDPKLAADRKALRASQQSSATTEQGEQSGNPLEGLEGAAFDRAWQAIARGRTN